MFEKVTSIENSNILQIIFPGSKWASEIASNLSNLICLRLKYKRHIFSIRLCNMYPSYEQIFKAMT